MSSNKRVTKICTFCNQDFSIKFSENARGRGRFCSKICYDNWQRRQQTLGVCLVCQKQFIKKTWKRNPEKFCSKQCYSLYRNRDKTGKFLAGEINGSKFYRQIAFENYKHECSVCGYKQFIEILEVHHIDGNRKNNKVENLQILCPNCHKIKTLLTNIK